MRVNYCECARCGRRFDVAPENMPMGTLDHPCYGRLPPEPAPVLRTVVNIMQRYSCSAEAAQLYCDLREEGYQQYQALLMVGLADPYEERGAVHSTDD